ncbi:SPOR domain-containing protein [Castellaniella denitrificans]|uniref:SPOR domain-containing protein n=1 Tax=Castellaniella denitrificans TaxID=56119 RepID=A0ABT4M0E2_9BURK|nr:SPOR domain-containing protein [Castellaniella denitrificans]MCZ4328779.1 SPOR domain-containing protein [Castellaniella denitrificans]
MATRKKSSSKSGGAWFGLVLGMVLGVAAAVAVALFVTKAPMPFKDKASRNAPTTLLPDVKNAPDPNIALYGKDGPAGTRSSAQGGSAANPPAPAPEPGAAPENPLSDAIGQIIAGLDKPNTKPAPEPARAPTAPQTSQPIPPPPPPPPAARPAPGTQTTYYLQTGAFRSQKEAQAMLARVVLLGLPVRIETGESNGAPINRVRVGPFKGIDEMNRARTRLGDDKIESTVVRP